MTVVYVGGEGTWSDFHPQEHSQVVLPLCSAVQVLADTVFIAKIFHPTVSSTNSD